MVETNSSIIEKKEGSLIPDLNQKMTFKFFKN